MNAPAVELRLASTRGCQSTGADHKPAPSSPETELRQLTVMFCDLADSSALSQPLAPEVLPEGVRAYHATAAEVILIR